MYIVIATTPNRMLLTIKAVCLSLCLYSQGIGMSSFCLRLWSFCGDMGKASAKDFFVPCTGCMCLCGTGIAFTPLFRPRSCVAVAITI